MKLRSSCRYCEAAAPHPCRNALKRPNDVSSPLLWLINFQKGVNFKFVAENAPRLPVEATTTVPVMKCTRPVRKYFVFVGCRCPTTTHIPRIALRTVAGKSGFPSTHTVGKVISPCRARGPNRADKDQLE
jgi:hypothetical protein